MARPSKSSASGCLLAVVVTLGVFWWAATKATEEPFFASLAILALLFGAGGFATVWFLVKYRPTAKARPGPVYGTWEGKPRLDVTAKKGWTDVVGESFHQDTLRAIDDGRLIDGVTVVFTALLVPEPTNPHRHNEIPILVVADGYGPVGHLSQADALRYRDLAAELEANGAVGECTAWLKGGWSDDISIGVKLGLLSPAKIKTEKGGAG